MKIDVPVILSLSFFAVNALLHLFLHKFGNLTKALIMPSILLCCFCVNRALPPVLIAAVVTSWLGDVLLEKNGFKWFTAGGLAFMASHMLYGLSYIPAINANKPPLLVLIPAVLIYCAVSCSTVWNIRKTAPKNSAVLLLLYLFTNAFMNILALMQLVTCVSTLTVIIYIGAVLFFISDNCLFYECFHKSKPNLFVPVMATYITGEFMIAFCSALK